MYGKVGHLKRNIKETELLLCFYLGFNEMLLFPSMSYSPDRRREVRGFLFREDGIFFSSGFGCAWRVHIRCRDLTSRGHFTACYLTSLSGDVSRLGQGSTSAENE